ncbi:hypothetical protein LEMLEM_LOCUS13709, partial [Lemmus lemmus]
NSYPPHAFLPPQGSLRGSEGNAGLLETKFLQACCVSDLRTFPHLKWFPASPPRPIRRKTNLRARPLQSRKTSRPVRPRTRGWAHKRVPPSSLVSALPESSGRVQRTVTPSL